MYDTARDMEWFWDKSKFINRVYLIRERYEHFAAGDPEAAASWGDENDPFWDPNEPTQARGCGPAPVWYRCLSCGLGPVLSSSVSFALCWPTVVVSYEMG